MRALFSVIELVQIVVRRSVGKIDVGRRENGEFNVFRRVSHDIRPVLLLESKCSQFAVGTDVLRFDLNRLLLRVQGLIYFFLLPIDTAKFEPGNGILRVDRYRLEKRLLCVGPFFRLRAGQPFFIFLTCVFGRKLGREADDIAFSFPYLADRTKVDDADVCICLIEGRIPIQRNRTRYVTCQSRANLASEQSVWT
jgi:hypothetical protein